MSDTVPLNAEVLDRLFQTIQSRKGADPSTSWTAKLFSKGRPKIAQKVGEEAVETVIAALQNDKEALAAESADLLYHLLVLWAEADVEPSEIWQTLAAREGTSGVAEKASRKQ